jgi:hypothetical protein
VGTVQMTLSKAHEAIGEFFCAFSNLERELGEAIKVVLRLRDHPAADAVVGLVGDFARKANIVREAVQSAKRPDGTDPDEKWKRDVDEMMKQILGCNRPHRTDLAHDYLEPHVDGSVSLQKPGEKTPRPWTSEDFSRKIANMNELANKVRTVRTDLTNLNIPVPTGWMSTCPICGAEAEKLPLTGDFQRILCPNHDFEVSGTAISIRRGKASPSHWETALERAKLRAESGKRPRIMDSDFP